MSTYYHLTDEIGFSEISREHGFRSVNGVCGIGVYLFDSLELAIEYADNVGLRVPVIFEVTDDAPISCAESEAGIPKNEGDSAFYEHVFLVPSGKPGGLWIPDKLSRVKLRR